MEVEVRNKKETLTRSQETQRNNNEQVHNMIKYKVFQKISKYEIGMIRNLTLMNTKLQQVNESI